MNDDDYLWDKGGEPDPTVAALEELLGPMGHDPQTPLDAATLRPRASAPRSRSRFVVIGLAAVLALAALGYLLYRAAMTDRGAAPPPTPIALANDAPLRVATASDPVQPGDTIIAGPQRATKVTVGSYGAVTVSAGTSVRVEENAAQRVRLALAKGVLDVDLSVAAPPRFFQVDTPAGRVVDLGCAYTLDVSDEGDLELHMLSGWVAIEHNKARVVVPAGATGTSTKGDGPSIPVFDRTEPAVVSAVEAYEQAGAWGDQRSRARALLDMLSQPHDTLIAWHLLTHPDEGIAGRAHGVLARLATKPATVKTADDERPTPAEREAWAAHLYESAWTASEP